MHVPKMDGCAASKISPKIELLDDKRVDFLEAYLTSQWTEVSDTYDNFPIDSKAKLLYSMRSWRPLNNPCPFPPTI